MTDERNNTSTPPADPATPATESAQASPAQTEASAGPSAEAVVATLTAERDKLKDQLLRALADHDNYRKRTRRDIDEAARKAREDLLRELLPVFDNLERASQYFDTGADASAVAKGVEMVLRLFEDTLTKIGAKRLHAKGKPFDPAHHEAIQQIESAEHPAGTVTHEEVAGYTLGDRLLRPSMVVVSKGAPRGDAGGGASA